MPVGNIPQSKIYPVAGVRLSTVAAGIRYPDRADLVLFEINQGANVSAVFTKNTFAAAPILICREHLKQDVPRYLLINTGNANAGTGEQGLRDANHTCEALASLVDVKPEQILPFSTGVTVEFLPVKPIVDNLARLVEGLQETAWQEAAKGIMTTDTVPKSHSVQFDIGGETVTLSGITKGSGMIKPDMATMLSFIATDAKINQTILNEMLVTAVNQSFNRITVEGDTSTNDACALVATGKGASIVSEKEQFIFQQYLSQLCETLAQYMVRDAEGATKFVTITIKDGANSKDCLEVAYRIAHSPLVKTAFFSGDANLGRIMVAIGNADVPQLDVRKVVMHVAGVKILEDGIDLLYKEELVETALKESELEVCVSLGMGECAETIWTCDLTHDYISINADYRS